MMSKMKGAGFKGLTEQELLDDMTVAMLTQPVASLAIRAKTSY
jgi:hypothetical protein